MDHQHLLNLINEFGFTEGMGGDYWFHKKDHNRTKPMLTKAACQKIARKRGYTHTEPIVEALCDRITIRGYWIAPPEGESDKPTKIWITGEANTAGRSVEGSHPLAMAEKRFKNRGIVALEFGEDGGVYTDDEFDDAYFERIAKQHASSQPVTPPPLPPTPPQEPHPQPHQTVGQAPASAPGPASDPAQAKHESYMRRVMRISELCGLAPGALARGIWEHCTKYESSEGWILPPVNTLQELYRCGKTPGAWVGAAIGNLDKIIKQLEGGQELQLEVMGDNPGELVLGPLLRPTASGGMPSEMPGDVPV